MFDPDAFSTDFALPETQPSPEPSDGESSELEPNGGPWITHGVIHLTRPPKNH